VNDQGDILYVSGRTGKYLEPAAGKANWNIFAMAREGLRLELQSGFRKALQQRGRPDGHVTLKNVSVGTNGGRQAVEVTLRVLEGPGALAGMVLIIFADVAAPAAKPPTRGKSALKRSSRAAALEQDLQQALQEVQLTREEMQTSQEELKSMNEELQSTNEELQSTNEELTTSKEEMQSLNEDLQTVNAELQTKVHELSRANNDMRNLLNSTDIATVFLDGDLRVRRFTTQAVKLMRLIPGDVGRPVTDLASDLLYPELTEDTREVLRTLMFVEKPIATRDGRWFATRIMPYRTLEDRIDGVVITFTDITMAKLLEVELRQAQAELEGRLTVSAEELAQAQAQGEAEIVRREQVERTLELYHGEKAEHPPQG
jgi:two-component system CheB/CheR fusion protein